jgi:hypothetical protein
MRLTSWIHSALHIGCVALLLLQGYRIQRERLLEANYLKRGFSGVGVPSTTLPPLACYRWRDPKDELGSPKAYFCFSPEPVHEAVSR